MSNPTSVRIHALLVGINHWKFPCQIPSLRGCHNDVELVHATLKRLFGEDLLVTVLHDEQATAAGIQTAFREVLIQPAQKWASENPGNAHQSPAFLFHYSGHGTQVTAPAGSKPSGLDETLCTFDMERGKMFGLRDWQLGELVDELTQHTDNATIVLDCCHSGSGIRDINTNLVARQSEPDLSPPPNDLRVTTGRVTRSLDDACEGFRLSVSDRSVLLAACKSTQKAFEHTVNPTGALANGNGANGNGANEVDAYGAFTYSLCEAIACMPPGCVPTYDQLYRTTSRFLSYKSRSQRPQLEGGRERTLFGSTIRPRDLWLSVKSTEAGRIEVDGGVCHGITMGCELSVFEPDVRSSHGTKPVARLRVVESETLRCFCESIDGESAIPLDAPVSVTKLAAPDACRRVRLTQLASGLGQTLQASLNHSMIRLVDSADADLVLSGTPSGFVLRDTQDRLLDELSADSSSSEISKLLTRWARFYAALEIRNKAVGPELAGKVSIRLVDAAKTGKTGTGDPFVEGEDGIVALPDRSVVRFEVSNDSRLPLYITLLGFKSSGEVVVLYPSDAGRREQLAPNVPYRSGKFRLEISDSTQMDCVETLKVIATKEEADFSLLQVTRSPKSSSDSKANQRSVSANRVPSSLSGFLKESATMDSHRDMVAIDEDEDDSWVTAELTYRLVRPYSQASIKVVGGSVQTLAGSGITASGITVESPSGFNAEMSFVTLAQQVQRSLSSRPPSWLRRTSALAFETPRLDSSRSMSDAPWAIEISGDDHSLGLITEKSPLVLRLPGEITRDHSLAVMADVGGVPYVVGNGGENSNSALVQWLPTGGFGNDSDGELKVGTRGLGRSVKLYVMRKLNLPSPGLGLHVARFVPTSQLASDIARPDERVVQSDSGEFRYGPIGAAKLREKKRVLLVVHGFQSDTTWMLEQVVPMAGQYDVVLTFDYESFNTGIAESGAVLAETLKSAGVTPGGTTKIDVVAHSMGALVTRVAIELHGGDQLIQRCLLIGPPNQGTLLAEGMKLAMWASTLLVCGTATAPWIARMLSKLLSNTVSNGHSLQDLRPDSEILQQLNANDERPLVPYHILAGEYRPANDEANTFLKKTAQVFWSGYAGSLKYLLEDRHDMIVGVRSMAIVRAGGDFEGKVKAEMVSSNHFNYLVDPSAKAKVNEWFAQS